MRFKLDEAKRLTNLCKHDIAFVGCEATFDHRIVPMNDDRLDYGDPGFVTLGALDGRVISIRKATRREQAFYFKYLED
jgi:uncharacterized DUF497 family protein